MIAHGWAKLMGFNEMADSFPDPLGIGSQWSLIGTVSAEVGCSILIILGLATRPAALGIAFTMAVAGFVIHADDPFEVKEKAFLFLTVGSTLLFTGAGAFSLDGMIGRKKRVESD